MICISVTAHRMKGLMDKVHLASHLSKIVEVRIDGVRDFNLKDLARFREIPARLIFTCRPEWAGGRFQGNEALRLALLQTALDSGRVQYVDAEYEVVKKLKPAPIQHRARRGQAKIIASSHNFKNTPSVPALKKLYRQLARLKPDVIKIVTTARSFKDNFKIFRLIEYARSKIPLIAFCMGEAGLISRVLYKRFGAWLTYACLDEHQATAPGQITYPTLNELYRADQIDKHTMIFGLIGNPVKYSLSSYLFNISFKTDQHNAVYLPFQLEDIREFKQLTKILQVQGYSVTMPFKQAVIKYLDELTPVAKAIGVVNTIVRTDGNRLRGANTDGQGALQALEQSIDEIRPMQILRYKKILILGAGGTARAIAYSLKQTRSTVFVSNRHLNKAQSLKRDLGCQVIRWNKLGRQAKKMNIIINTTPVGMAPHIYQSPVNKKIFRKGMIVFDAIYNPPLTQFLHKAQEKGCFIISGIDMFFNQARLQDILFDRLLNPR